MAKMREIAEAEDIDEIQELMEMKEKTAVTVAEQEVDEVEELTRVVAPGFRLWQVGSVCDLGAMAKVRFDALSFDSAHNSN